MTQAHEICDSLAELHYDYRTAVRSEIRLRNAALARIRRTLGWRVDLSKKKQAMLNARAKTIFDDFRRHLRPSARQKNKGKPLPKSLAHLGAILTMADASLAPIEAQHAAFDALREELAGQLPVAEWFASIKGVGLGSLATIIGETGDLSKYPNHRHAWKRLGLAPKQCYAMMTKSGKEAFAVPKQRKSELWVIADCLMKGNSNADGKGRAKANPGPYRKLYVEAKALEEERGRKSAHRLAMRKVACALVRDLWREWNNGG